MICKLSLLAGTRRRLAESSRSWLLSQGRTGGFLKLKTNFSNYVSLGEFQGQMGGLSGQDYSGSLSAEMHANR